MINYELNGFRFEYYPEDEYVRLMEKPDIRELTSRGLKACVDENGYWCRYDETMSEEEWNDKERRDESLNELIECRNFEELLDRIHRKSDTAEASAEDLADELRKYGE